MNSYARRFEADIRAAARVEGIALTPSGEALFARDAPRLAELRAEDQRTPEEIAEDVAMASATPPHAYLDTYRAALRDHWPGAVKPADVADLHRLCDSVIYTAPELYPAIMGRAWAIFERNGDTEIGRAAVAFTWALALDCKEHR